MGCAAAPTSRAVVLNETVLDELVLWGRGGPSYADVAQGAGGNWVRLGGAVALTLPAPGGERPRDDHPSGDEERLGLGWGSNGRLEDGG